MEGLVRDAIYRIVLVALFFVSVTSFVLAGNTIMLACRVTGVDGSTSGEFSAVLCEEAAEQLRSASGQIVETTDAETIHERSSSAWLRLDVVVKSAYAATGRASWGGGTVEPGEGPQLEAGIDDASLNQATAALLATALIAGSPFQSGQ
jgi:hypothetical protein